MRQYDEEVNTGDGYIKKLKTRCDNMSKRVNIGDRNINKHRATRVKDILKTGTYDLKGL